MSRDQRSYREVDRQRRRAGKSRPGRVVEAGDGLAHLATGASMPHTLCGKRVSAGSEWGMADNLPPCPECSS